MVNFDFMITFYICKINANILQFPSLFYVPVYCIIKNEILNRKGSCRFNMENRFLSINNIGKAIENELDFDFSVNEKYISSLDAFNELLKQPFQKGNNKIFYRGERINDFSRPLIPTLLRNRNQLLKKGELVVNIDSEYLLDFYKSHGEYYNIFKTVFGNASKYRLYELCAFSQHYLDISPFIDFTKSLYVALSFALKSRQEFSDDIVVYTVELNDFESYTDDIVTAECWLNNYKVTVYNSADEIRTIRPNISPAALKAAKEALEARSQISSPKARLIDIPTNDFMKYQQGVFLLLTDYIMLHKSYLTKNIREDFRVTKYVISKDICKSLCSMISEEAPWYEFECLLDIKTAIKKATNPNTGFTP